MKPLYLYLTILTLALSSCQSLKNLSPTEFQIQEIEKNNFSTLNGQYKNVQDTVFGQIVHLPGRGLNENDKKLNDRLFLFVPKYGYNESSSVKLEFESNRKCTVIGLYNSQILFEKKLKGKFKSGYFYVRPKFYLIPFFPLYYVHRFKRIRIGKTISNDLVIDHTEKMWGFALFAGGEDKGRVTSIYKTETKNNN